MPQIYNAIVHIWNQFLASLGLLSLLSFLSNKLEMPLNRVYTEFLKFDMYEYIYQLYVHAPEETPVHNNQRK